MFFLRHNIENIENIANIYYMVVEVSGQNRLVFYFYSDFVSEETPAVWIQSIGGSSPTPTDSNGALEVGLRKVRFNSPHFAELSLHWIVIHSRMFRDIQLTK